MILSDWTVLDYEDTAADHREDQVAYDSSAKSRKRKELYAYVRTADHNCAWA